MRNLLVPGVMEEIYDAWNTGYLKNRNVVWWMVKVLEIKLTQNVSIVTTGL